MIDLLKIQLNQPLEEEEERPAKKRKLLEFAPLSTKWKTLMDLKIIDITFSEFLLSVREKQLVQGKADLPSNITAEVNVVLNRIKKFKSLCVPPENEGYPMTVWTIIVEFLTESLNTMHGKGTYLFSIYPVIKPNTKDHWKDKKSDFIILKIKNRQTIIVIELKLSVGCLTGADKDSVAQLFSEGYIISNEESTGDHNLLCIYTNHEVFHVFDMNLRKPIQLNQCYSSLVIDAASLTFLASLLAKR